MRQTTFSPRFETSRASIEPGEVRDFGKCARLGSAETPQNCRLGFEELSLTCIAQDSVNPRFNTIGTANINLMGPSEAL